jgi:hypothetical protein
LNILTLKNQTFIKCESIMSDLLTMNRWELEVELSSRKHLLDMARCNGECKHCPFAHDCEVVDQINEMLNKIDRQEEGPQE